MSKAIGEMFKPFQKQIDDEQEIREKIRTKVKDLESHSRDISTELQIIHQDNLDVEEIHKAILKSREIFNDVQKAYKELSECVPKHEYYRYHDHWRFVSQRLSFMAALIVFLETGTLVKDQDVEKILGLDELDTMFLEMEDYLMGTLQLCSELSRFAVNAVTSGDYERPLQISKFVGDLNAGFRLLNLKNDSLRKRVDGLKYDVKKIEEVVYDLKIRGLTN